MLKNKIPEEKVDSLLSKGSIPIIDLAHAGTEECPIKSVVNRVAHQLQKSLKEKGLAMLVNHGISEEKLRTAWDYLDEFVKLPMEIKEKYIRRADKNHGYVQPDDDSADAHDTHDGEKAELRHAFNICTLKLNSLPDEPLPGFRDHIAELAKDFKNLSGLILQALAVSLELPLNFFTEKHSHMLSGDNDNETTLRMLYYPPLVEDDNKCEFLKGQMQYSYQRCAMDRPDLGLNEPTELDDDEQRFTRCGTHADYGTFTLLAQDSEGGLEAKMPCSEKWQRVGHLPGAILINTGEILQTWTDNKYPALPHRVVIPEQASIRSRGRHSIAYFCHPDNMTEIVPTIVATRVTNTSTVTKKSKNPFKNKILNAYQSVQRKFNCASSSSSLT